MSDDANEQINQLKRDLAAAEAALLFYADPDTYFAVGFMFDRPCGELIDDFETVHDGEPTRPGKRARAYFKRKENEDG